MAYEENTNKNAYAAQDPQRGADARPGSRYYDGLIGKVAQADCEPVDDSALRPSAANARQVAGSHYAGEYQHWDFVREMGLNYLQGCATKYVARWRKKNGITDLDKALHYIQKSAESKYPASPRGAEDRHWGPHSFSLNSLFRFGKANGLNLGEVAALTYIVRGEWEDAAEVINEMIAERRAAEATLVQEHFQS